MSIDPDPFDRRHLLGEAATCPIEPPQDALAALLVLAGTSQQSPLPCRARASQSQAPFVLSKSAQALLEPQHSPLPAHPAAAHSGAFNCAI